MTRSLLRFGVKDDAGNAIENALLYLFLEGTTSPVSDAWTAKTGGTQITTAVTNPAGQIEVWFDSPKNIDIKVTDNAHTALLADTGTLQSWTDFTKTVAVVPNPSDVVLTRTSPVFDLVRVKGRSYADVTHPDFGADPTGVADSAAALAAAYNSLVDGGTLRIPGGTYRCLNTVLWSGNKRVKVDTDGSGTVLEFRPTSPITDGLRIVDAGEFSLGALRVRNTAGSSTITNLVHYTTTGSSQMCALRDLLIDPQAAGVTNKLAIGRDTSLDVAEILLENVVCAGVASSLAALVVGNGTAGNVSNIRAYGCTFSWALWGVLCDGAMVQMYGCTLQGNSGADIKVLTANGQPLVWDGGRSEISKKMYEYTQNGGYPFPIALRNIVMNAFTDPGGVVMTHAGLHAITLENITVINGVAPGIFVITSPVPGGAVVAKNILTKSSNPFPPHANVTVNWLRPRRYLDASDLQAPVSSGETEPWDFNEPVRFRRHIWADATHADFGAEPGGSAAANNVALQAWLDACKAENLHGFLPADDLPYDISTTLNFTQKVGWKLEGIGVGHSDAASPRSRIRWTGAAGGTMMLLQGVRDGMLSGILLDCNSLAAVGIDYDATAAGIVSTQNDFERVTIVRATDRGLRIAKSNFQTDLTNFYSCYFFANNIGVSIEDANAVWHEFFGCRWTHNAVGITAAFAGTGGQFNIHGGRFLGNTSHDIQTYATRAFFINAQSEGSNRFLLGHGANAYAGAPVTLAGCAVMTVEAADRIGIQWDTASPLVITGGHFFSDDPAKSFKFGMSNTRRSTIHAIGTGFDGNPCTETNLPYNGVVRLDSCWYKDTAGTAGTADIGTIDGAVPLFSPSTAIALSTVTAGAPNFGWGEVAWVKIPSGTALTTGANTFYAAFYHANGSCRFSIPHVTAHGGAEAVFLGIDAVDNDAAADQSCKVVVRVTANFTLTSDLVFAIRVRPEPTKYL